MVELFGPVELAGPPPRENADGIRSTHEPFVDVDPWSMEAKAVQRLHALGPLRGDNFCRFAIHDGWGVLRAMEQSGEMGEVAKPKKKRNESGAPMDGGTTGLWSDEVRRALPRPSAGNARLVSGRGTGTPPIRWNKKGQEEEGTPARSQIIACRNTGPNVDATLRIRSIVSDPS